MTNDNDAAPRRITTIIMRESADPFGPRIVTDDAAPLAVHTFCVAGIADAVADGKLATPGAYLFVGADATYVGESGNVGRRLAEQAADPSKRFATDVYVIVGFERRLSKEDAVHLQKKLSAMVEGAGVVRLEKGNGPRNADLPAWRVATLDRAIADTLPLIFDAGCRCLTPRPAANGAAVSAPASDGAEANGEDDDEGPMEVGVTTVPIGVEELELAYTGLWARGYQNNGRFIVAAGSEMRAVPNASTTEHTLKRRKRLTDIGAAVPIAGTTERLRLEVAVAFPSRAIAGKVLSGAHLGSDKWRQLQTAAPVILTT